MYSSIKKLTALTALSLVAFLAVGVATAGAHGGPGRAGKKANTSALVTQAAKQLDVTRAKLVSAIEAAAAARIDEAVEDEDIDADEAVDLKEEALDNLRLAMQLSRTKAVASNLGITPAQLNSGFRAARKALAIAQIDKALAAGTIDADEAAEQKADLEGTDLPGYKAGGLGVGGLGVGLGQQGGCSGGGRG
jgi:prophage DNA circulation protein